MIQFGHAVPPTDDPTIPAKDDTRVTAYDDPAARVTSDGHDGNDDNTINVK